MYDPELYKEAGERAIENFMEKIRAVIDLVSGPDGEVPGMVPMTPGDRIADNAWMMQSGAMDALKLVNPDRYEERWRQYLEDMKHSPFVAGTYETPAFGNAP